MKLTFIPSVFLLCLSLCSYGQCTTRLLNEQWNFRFFYQVEPHTTISVTLPHTWNVQDALFGKIDYKRGIGNYEHLLYIFSEWKGKHLFLCFDGINSIADVFINAKYVGEHHEEDVRLLLEMGVNAACLAHYQQVEAMYDLMDKAGIAVWTEIPFVGPGGYLYKGFVDSSAFRENGEEQLLELIRQNDNHLFICFWELFNELKESGDNPIPYVEALNALAHIEDPVFFTTSASNQEGALNFITDCIALNRYDGWYDGMPDALRIFGDRTHVDYPRFCMGLCEYGVGPIFTTNRIYGYAQYWESIDIQSWQTFYHMRNFGIGKSGDYQVIVCEKVILQDAKIKSSSVRYPFRNWRKGCQSM